MVTLSQSTWNLLFSWITGKQCFIPEGCNPPVEGIFVYLVILLVIVLALWKREELIQKFSSL
jgi:hypothetical protein